MLDNISKNPIKFGIFISMQHKKWVVIALLSVTVATALDRFSVVILQSLTNAIAAKPVDFNSLWMWAILYPTLSFIARNTWRSSGFSGMRWFVNFRATSSEILYEYLTLHSKDYFNSKFAGALTNKVSNAVDGSQHLFEKVLWRFFPLVIGLFWYIAISWAADYRLGLIIAIWSIFILLINAWFAKKLQPYSYKFSQSLSLLKGKLVDSLSNISLVHEYAYVAGEREYINEYIANSKKADMTNWRLSEWVLVLNGVFITIFMFAMISTAVYLFQTNSIALGVVIMVIAIATDLSSQFVFIAQEMRDTASYYGQAKEGLEEILKDHVIKNSPNAVELNFSAGEISIESVDFDYENSRVFKNFSLKIPAGQKVGLVGRSGAGKTTFVSLLLRHFNIKKGAIKIDGQDISEVTLESLRRAIAFVPQDTSLFHRTIRENIAYSNPSASENKVRRAAKLAQADGFINKLPLGYETMVGERGVKLSGGQRQRIAIARAFLKNSPILVLDEATSSLDSHSEHAIQESLDELMKNRTVIAIAHRLSTLKKMDRIVILHNGKIVEDGTPDNLLKKENGRFKKLWDHQVKGFILDE